MRKEILTVALLAFCAGNVSAQKWLKNLGKTLNKVEQALQSDDKKTDSNNAQTTSKGKQQSNKADYTLSEVLQVNNSVVAQPVDLGLSVKWASKNLGAAQPFQYGGYYDRTAEYLNSYWGEEWRLPTEKEFEELFTKCTVKYVDAVLAGKEYMPDVAGYLMITGPNGNKIWLPAAGGKNKPTDERYNNPPGNEGFYWTSESGRNGLGGTSYKRMFFQHIEGKFKYYSELYTEHFGASIRPIYVGKTSATSADNASGVFDGTWCLTSESSEVYLTLTPKGEKNEEIDAIDYGSISTVFLPGYRMDNDWITSLRVEGNTAYVEYQCERTSESGKAKITYNPTAKTMKVVVTKAINGDCYATDITLKKCKPLNEQ